MTVDINLGKVQYDGNDIATVFSFNFKVFLAASLKVIHTDALAVETVLVQDTDYTITGIGDESGGSITYPISGDPLPTGETITLQRYPEPLQEVNFLTQGGWTPQTIEDALDLMTHYQQFVDEVTGRTLMLPVSYSGSASVEVPIPVASKALMVNEAGDGLEWVSPGSVALATPADESIIADMIDVTDIVAIATKLAVLKLTGGTMTGNIVDLMARFKRTLQTGATYTILSTDCVVEGDATAQAQAFTLPTAVGLDGKMYMVKKMDVSGNAVTLTGAGAELIDAANTKVLAAQYNAVIVVSDNVGWSIFAEV